MNEKSLRDEIASLERSLIRERKARKNAEDILRQKAMEAFEINERLQTATERLRLALWASRESVWEWNAKEDTFRLYTAITTNEVQVSKRGTFQDTVDSIHPDHQAEYLNKWLAHERQESKSFDVLLPRFSESTQEYRWSRMRGRISKRDENGKALHFMGLFKDANSSVLRDETYQTIVDAFLHSSRPGFIINLKTMHVECNILGYQVLGVSTDESDNEILAQKLPTSAILQAINNNERKFAATVTNKEGNDQTVGIYLSEIPDMTADTPHCVGFFSTQTLTT